jgi:diguanylate cyclase (GGDEF)-like protein
MPLSCGDLDRITWLPDRELFKRRLNRVLSRPGRARFALLYLDLDRFGDFNELFGGELGDRVLREAAARVARACPQGAALARLGGDDFAALVKDADLERATEVARELLRLCGEPYVIGCVSVAVTASIGIGLFPLHAHDGASLLRTAEEALHRAKLSGRNCIYPPPTCCGGTAL